MRLNFLNVKTIFGVKTKKINKQSKFTVIVRKFWETKILLKKSLETVDSGLYEKKSILQNFSTLLREGGKLLRNLLNNFKNHHHSLNFRDKNILSFNAIKQANFFNFVHFHYNAVEKLDSSTPSFDTQNQPFFMYQQYINFKQKPSKIINTKSKYWLDDFFTGGKDEFSRNSLVLSNCSNSLRTQTTNFF